MQVIANSEKDFIVSLSERFNFFRSIPPRFKVDVEIAKGTHASEDAVNKQLADKVNKNILKQVLKCLCNFNWPYSMIGQNILLQIITIIRLFS